MNSFGRIFRVHIFGESHGTCVGILLDGVPAGIKLDVKELNAELKKRKAGLIGTTKRIEKDTPCIMTGLYNGRTTGAPILITFDNKNKNSKPYEEIKYTPRPGHADLASWMKYFGFNDNRGAGPFSGRLTVGLVCAGLIAKKVIKDIRIESKFFAGNDIKKAMQKKDSVGGIVECVISKIPAGLGEPFFDSMESVLSHALFSIPGVKGIEFGVGFEGSLMLGSEYNDQIIDINGKTRTNNSGGVNGGITNGNDLTLRLALRPASSIGLEQETIDLRTGKMKKIKIKGSHDVCYGLRVPVIVNAVCSIVLADMMLMRKALCVKAL